MKLETASCADSLGDSMSEDERAWPGGLDLRAFAPDAIRRSGSSAISSLSTFAFGPVSSRRRPKFSGRHSFLGGFLNSQSFSGKQSSSSNFNSNPPQSGLKSALQARGGARRPASEVSSVPTAPSALDPVKTSREVSMDDGFEAANAGEVANQKNNIVPLEQAAHQALEKMQDIAEEGQQEVSNTAEDAVPSPEAPSGVMTAAPEPVPEPGPETVPEAAPSTILVTQKKDKEKTSPEMNEIASPSQETGKCGAGSDIKDVDKKTDDPTRNFRFNPEWAQNPTAKLLRGFKRHTLSKSSEMVEETASPSKRAGDALNEPNSDHKAKEASSSTERRNGAGKQTFSKHTINLNRDDSKDNVWTLPKPNSKKNDARSVNNGDSSPSNPSTPVERFQGVRGFWEQKTLRFSGTPQLSKGRLTTEAQAT